MSRRVNNGQTVELTIAGVHNGTAGMSVTREGKLTCAFRPNAMTRKLRAGDTATLDGTPQRITSVEPSVGGLVVIVMEEIA